MGSASGDALEWALALLQAPAERHALRQRPLPDGMLELLEITAGGASQTLMQAAARFAVPEGKLREAAQFYVREVLLTPQADAYRILGVAQDAGRQQIKQHHRLLQRWLHPDRAQGAADAILATRVNAAWQQLRTPERRAHYDAHLHEISAMATPAGSEMAIPARVWVAVEKPVPLWWRWLRRLPVLLLCLLCVGLIGLIWNDRTSRPEPIVARSEASNNMEPRDGLHVDRVREELRARNALPAPSAVLPAASQPAAATDSAPQVLAPQRDTAQPTAVVPLKEEAKPSAREEVKAVVKSLSRAEVETTTVETRAPAPLVHAESSMSLPSEGRIVAAQQVGATLLRYLQTPGQASPSIWGSPAVQQTAAQMQQESNAAGGIRMAPAQWRIGSDSAELVTRYQRVEGNGEAGVFTATLQWRENRWWVTGLGMGQLQ